MKRVNIWILVLICIFIFGLFALWQYSIYQILSKMDISCGGDWSYNVRCPVGSYCQPLGEGQLAGGLCKSFLAPLFDVFVKSESITYLRDLPNLPTPTEQPATEKIISSVITVSDCKIKVNTTKGEFFLDTNFLKLNPETKCYQFVLSRVSPSGEYVVFQDISEEKDSLLKVYSLEHNDTIQLDVLGTANIFDIIFLPDDKLIALYGERDLQDRQLKIFDLSGLFIAYPSNIDREYKYFTNLAQYSKNIYLPYINYSVLSVSGDKLQVHFGITTSRSAIEYSFEELSK